MGSYTELSVSGYPIVSSKSYAIPTVMTIFRETDKRVFQRRVSERNPVVWGVTPPEEDDDERAVTYECVVGNVSDRLDVMGFTIKRCRDDFERIRVEQIEEYKSWENEDREDFYSKEIQFLESLTFEKYLEVLGEIIRDKEKTYHLDYEKLNTLDPVRKHIFSNEEYELGLFGTDIRSLIRVACSIVSRHEVVTQDLTEVVNAGYYSENDDVCESAVRLLTADHPENAPRIILTEGSSDVEILRQGLSLLYPHLVGYYCFLDFSASRAQGGAGNLVNTVKSFSGAGVSNRIIAIFDNDAAGFDARRLLAAISLPRNIAVCNYPNTDFLRSYPTLGPSGRVDLDVNGLAASIELYLGTDVLTGSNGQLHPVQWKGFIESLGKYQGEVMHKSEIQAMFFKKAARCASSPVEMQSADWRELREVFQVIFHAFD